MPGENQPLRTLRIGFTEDIDWRTVMSRRGQRHVHGFVEAHGEDSCDCVFELLKGFADEAGLHAQVNQLSPHLPERTYFGVWRMVEEGGEVFVGSLTVEEVEKVMELFRTCSGLKSFMIEERLANLYGEKHDSVRKVRLKDGRFEGS